MILTVTNGLDLQDQAAADKVNAKILQAGSECERSDMVAELLQSETPWAF